MINFLFWFSLSFILYTYIGYPVLLFAWCRIFPKPVCKQYLKPEPMVSVLISVRNEGKNIRARIENLAQQNYPAEKIEIIVISDGSNDDTIQIVKSLIDEFERSPSRPLVKLIEVSESMGKANALNIGVTEAKGDFIIFSDARQKFNDMAFKELLANFIDPEIGCASGELSFSASVDSPVKIEMGYYWSIEKKVRQWESTIYSVAGATGAIYAIRRELYPILPTETLLDDVFIPMSIVLKGFRNINDRNAIALDVFSESYFQEKKRKVRTLVGNYQVLSLLPQLLSPLKNQIFFRYLSHKVFRLMIPIFFSILIITSLLLEGLVHRIILGSVIVTIILTALNKSVAQIPVINQLSNASRTFYSLNYFALLAFLTWIKLMKREAW